MWKCPKCGRSFKKQNQDHYCGKAPETIDEYIAAQPEEAQRYLNQVREAIRSALPEAQERISWSMPAYWKGHNIIHFAGFKKHIGLYPGPEAVAEFAERLKEYKTSKGTIQLPLNKPLPLELIAEIAAWCGTAGNHPKEVSAMKFSKIYPLLVQKAERKNRSKEEVDEVICWLTGYDRKGLARQIERETDYETFFREAPAMNPNCSLIKGKICGIAVEAIEDPLMQKIRYLDKLVDELAKGKPMEKILRA